ncbi:unnamed protein product [Acanthosepion pharaonis]|uniref:Organic cation transporter n=1 Tax=Acanthosepion pharaonis TaxID=158019 RepID=A0A812AKW5_ACAPH|nr:unnamed protein product [Sepia pharaonis]
MKYDEIIEDVGGCGLYQKFILTFLYILSVLDGLQFGSLVFIAPEINHRCAIPDLPNDTYEVQDTDHADLIKAYIPQYIEDGERKYNNCYFYSNETLDSNGTMLACNSWVYDKSQYQTSVTSDMNLWPSEVLDVLVRSLYMSLETVSDPHLSTIYTTGLINDMDCPRVAPLVDESLLKKTLIFMLGWGSIIFVYYGLTLNIGVLAALYTCEHYPTCIRNSSVGFFGGFAEFVSILSPYIMGVSTLVPGRLGKSLPLMLMGIACFVSGIFIIFLPETTNKPMQDTMDEVMNNKHINNK